MERTSVTAAVTALPVAAPSTPVHRPAFLLGLLCGGLLAIPVAWQLLQPHPASTAAPAATLTPLPNSAQPVGNHHPAPVPTTPRPIPAPVQDQTQAPARRAVTETSRSGTINWTLGQIDAHPKAATDASTQPSTNSDTATGKHAAALLQTLQTLRVDAHSRLADWMRQYPQLATRIDRLSRQHGKQADPLLFNGPNGLSTLLLAFKLHGDTLRTADTHPQTTADGSTLIIDARGLPLQPALYPRLLDAQGQTRYALEQTDPNRIASHGLSLYAASLSAARELVPAGQTALIIQASQLAPGTDTDLLLPDGSLPRHIQPPIIIVTDTAGTLPGLPIRHSAP